jgi:hypothetical protein
MECNERYKLADEMAVLVMMLSEQAEDLDEMACQLSITPQPT